MSAFNTFRCYEECDPSVVRELKEAVESTHFDGIDYKFSDVAYLRFLTACQQNKDAAYKGMIEHMEWRKTKAVAEIDVERDCPNEVSKGILLLGKDFDRSGRPIIYVLVRKVDKHNRDINELEKFIIGNMQRALTQAVEDEEKMSIVMDMKAFTLDNMDFELAKLLIDTLQNQFRENLANLFILNAPFIFQAW